MGVCGLYQDQYGEGHVIIYKYTVKFLNLHKTHDNFPETITEIFDMFIAFFLLSNILLLHIIYLHVVSSTIYNTYHLNLLDQ